MNKVKNRKGISLVALVITIIVLVILTGAVVITGVNVPQQGQLAVFKNNIGNVQDAVTMKMLNNMVNYRQENNENIKWIGIINGYDEEDIGTAPVFDTKINDVDVAALDVRLKSEVSLKDEDFEKYYVDANGVIYHTGFVYDYMTYYNGSTSVTAIESISITGRISKTTYTVGDRIDKTGLVVTAVLKDGTTEDVTGKSIFTPELSKVTGTEGNKEISVSFGGREASEKIQIQVVLPEWISASTSLNPSKKYVSEMIEGITYYAPIPKEFTVSTASTEDQISEGLVIEDGNNNQFVWVPVNDRLYNISNAQGAAIAAKNALKYWQDSSNGVGTEGVGINEPYPRTENNNWLKDEWDAMYASVMRYGGFYMGKYEAGVENGTYDSTSGWSSTSIPVVKSGAEIWNNIAWGASNTETGTLTATAISRSMYKSTDKYGVVSTLVYGIQWDSAINWAKCASNVRPSNTYATANMHSAAGELYKDGVTYDVNKNIYDLAGNVREWSMEASGTKNRERLGGYFATPDPASNRRASGPLSTHSGTVGFRIALYIK